MNDTCRQRIKDIVALFPPDDRDRGIDMLFTLLQEYLAEVNLRVKETMGGQHAGN